jgi:hypothetical protein
MKSILEVTPRGDTLFSMPDEIYDAVNRMLISPGLRPVGKSGRSRSLSVTEAVAMLPTEFKCHVTSKPCARPKQEPDSRAIIYYDEIS